MKKIIEKGLKMATNAKVVTVSTVTAFALFVYSSNAFAAVDSDLQATIASTTAFANDNKATMISFYVTLGMISLGIGMSIGAILVSIKWIKRAFFGGRRR